MTPCGEDPFLEEALFYIRKMPNNLALHAIPVKYRRDIHQEYLCGGVGIRLIRILESNGRVD